MILRDTFPYISILFAHYPLFELYHCDLIDYALLGSATHSCYRRHIYMIIFVYIYIYIYLYLYYEHIYLHIVSGFLTQPINSVHYLVAD